MGSHNLPLDLHIFITGDGSPTLSFERADGYGEKMHHSAGALSESIYIYQSVVVDLLSRGWPARVLSFGLGLGYNELLAIAEFVRHDLKDWKIYSFEAHPYLSEGFLNWLEEGDSALTPILDQVCAQIAVRLEIPAIAIKNEARSAIKDGRFEIRGAFPECLPGARDCSLVFYDAFSNKMDTEPWQESTFEQVLAPSLATRCLFTTYAVTGNLKRGLKALGFQLIDRPGFQGKRESTLAIREEIR